jgi:AraC-like DNA-binding protein
MYLQTILKCELPFGEINTMPTDHIGANALATQSNSAEQDENLALRPHVRIGTSTSAPTGGGARDPHVLLTEIAHQSVEQLLLNSDYKGFDTYDGQNASDGPDWYIIEFPEPMMFNCVEMTMGLPYRDGGWWTSLNVEVKLHLTDPWSSVQNLTITPAYDFEDNRAERRPLETYALMFEQVIARAVRLIGKPGGIAQFTSLVRLAVYHRDLSRWNPSCLPEPPVPYIFQLIAPQVIWDLSENLAKLTGLVIDLPFLEYYLDAARYEKFWRRIRRNYEGEPELWFLVGATLGWDVWNRITVFKHENGPLEPHVRLYFHDTFASAVAPIIVENRVISEMTTSQVMVNDRYDEPWHKKYALEHDVSWESYCVAIERSPHMTMEQLEGAAGLLGMIANTIANLAHRNRYLERELDGARRSVGQRAFYRKEIVRRAIDFMQANLENQIGVSDVAQAMGLSLPYFSTLFAEQTGKTASDYLIDLRLERAKEYLAHTPISVMEVCVALDYSPSYFSRLFKDRLGCTPGQYAQKMRS